MKNIQLNYYPSVTEVLSTYIDKRWYSPASAEFGTQIHYSCKDILNGDLSYENETNIYAPSIKSFIEWIKITDPIPFTLEEKIINHKLPLSGRPDFIGTITGRDGYGIIDWKTSVSTQKWWPLQLSAYKYLADKYYEITIEWIATLRIRKKGGKALFNDYTPIYKQSLKKFLRAYSLHMGF